MCLWHLLQWIFVCCGSEYRLWKHEKKKKKKHQTWRADIQHKQKFDFIPSVWLLGCHWPNPWGKHCNLLELSRSYVVINKKIIDIVTVSSAETVRCHHLEGLLTPASCLWSFALTLCMYLHDLRSLVICFLLSDTDLCHTNLNAFDAVRWVLVSVCPFEMGTNL